jgi:histidine triad (HIT) family protein
MDADCIFCKIANRSIPAPLVFESPDVVAFQDINPQAPQHVLIIPREHYANVGELARSGQEALLGKILSAATEIATKLGLDASGYRLVTNTGKDGGQTVKHLHVHLLGGRPLGWPPG